MKVNYPVNRGVPARQRGAVLFVALIFLILLTLLGLAASGNSILQERMTGGVRNRQLALMGAESGARGANRRCSRRRRVPISVPVAWFSLAAPAARRNRVPGTS